MVKSQWNELVVHDNSGDQEFPPGLGPRASLNQSTWQQGEKQMQKDINISVTTNNIKFNIIK